MYKTKKLQSFKKKLKNLTHINGENSCSLKKFLL